jgi:hypothetical protein
LPEEVKRRGVDHRVASEDGNDDHHFVCSVLVHCKLHIASSVQSEIGE